LANFANWGILWQNKKGNIRGKNNMVDKFDAGGNISYLATVIGKPIDNGIFGKAASSNPVTPSSAPSITSGTTPSIG
jgi:hypothetical protein